MLFRNKECIFKDSIVKEEVYEFVKKQFLSVRNVKPRMRFEKFGSAFREEGIEWNFFRKKMNDIGWVMSKHYVFLSSENASVFQSLMDRVVGCEVEEIPLK